MRANRDPVIVEALRAVSMAKIAEACGITVQAVSLWNRVPAQHVLNVERVTAIPRERLRPDLYDAPRPRRRRPASQAAA